MRVTTDTARPTRVSILMLVVAGIATVLTSWGVGGAHAGPPTYPTVDVQVGAAARSEPSVNDAYRVGWVLSETGGSTQKSWVRCWEDGDWATGNYATDRWFEVYVTENPDGYYSPKWLYVHASYVYNQVIVPKC